MTGDSDMLKAALEGRIGFVSSGDPEEDERTRRDILLRAGREAEGLCPNGCGPIEIPEPNLHKCPICGFVGVYR